MRRLAGLPAGLAVGLVGGMVAGLADSVAIAKPDRDLMTARLWLDNVSFAIITHTVLAIAVCTIACLLGSVAGLFRKRLRGVLLPGALACAGFLLAEAIVVVLMALRFYNAAFLRGTSATVVIVAAWLIGLAPACWLCLWVWPTLIGRLATRLIRAAAWPAVVVAVFLMGFRWQDRATLQDADGFWPMPLATAASRPSGLRPNVVFIVFDTLRADRLGCYGYHRATSPHIDAFAADAVVFTRAISSAPWTLPSHASMFTGLYTSQHGTVSGWLDECFVTLAEALRDRGYQTMGLSNNGLVAQPTGLSQGFERFAEPQELLYRKHSLIYGFLRYGLLCGRPLGPVLGRWFLHDAGGRAANELAEQWLGSRDRSRPLLLFINYMETHGPFEPPDAFRKPFVQPGDATPSYYLDQSRLATWLYSLTDKPIYTERDLRILSDLYDGRVREVDHDFADLMRILAAEIDLDETIVVLVSDHGENLGEHGLVGHQFSIHNTLLHVPLIVRWPKALRPQRVDRLVQTCDLFPSILAWTGTGVRQATKVMARPLMPDTSPASQDAHRYAIAEYLMWPEPQLAAVQAADPAFEPSRWRVAYRAILDERWKLVFGTGGLLRLYDIQSDPGENDDLAASHRSTAIRLSQQFGHWLRSFKRFDPNQVSGQEDPRLDQERRDRLRDLGYIP